MVPAVAGPQHPGGSGFHCPHCQVTFHDTWLAIELGADADGYPRLLVKRNCPACRKLILHLARVRGDDLIQAATMVWPHASARRPCPAEVPTPYAQEYTEACLVLELSPRASAAMSRRCLQNIIHDHLGIKKGDLAKEIQALLDGKTLPPSLGGQVDGIRHVGNFAAHPIKSQVTGQVMDVEPGEAAWNLDTLEELFDFCFVAPARVAQKRAAVNAKLAEAGKPPMK